LTGSGPIFFQNGGQKAQSKGKLGQESQKYLEETDQKAGGEEVQGTKKKTFRRKKKKKM